MGRALRRAVLCLAVIAAPVTQAQPLVHEHDAPRETTALIPLVEVPLVNVALATFNRLVFRDEWTIITPATILRNARGGWVFDENGFEINTIGHPYQGSVYFNAARSAGLGFWQALLATFLGSLMWEIAGESEPPSINDQITTPFGGALLGEALHRTSLAMLYAPGDAPTWARLVGATLANPIGLFNRAFFGTRYEPADHRDEMPLLGTVSVGMNALGFVSAQRGDQSLDQILGEEAHFAARLRAGFPGRRGYEPRAPFDHFDVRAEVSVSRQPYAGLFITGLLWGRGYQFGGTGAGVWGLFGNFDFANPGTLRVSTVSTGPGTTFAVDFGEGSQLQVMLVTSGVGWGAIGALPTAAPELRDYHIGPGFQLFGELALVHRNAGSVHVGLRQYIVTGAYDEPGTEQLTWVQVGLRVSINSRFELAADAVMSTRNASYTAGREDFWQRASQVRVGVVWLTDRGHGATPRAP